MAERRSESRCPICHRSAVAAYRPFCSPRCAEVDLGRWLTEQYRISGPPVEAEDEDESGFPPPASR